MTKSELFKSLNYVDGTRVKRIEVTQMVLNNPPVISPLMEIAFEDNGVISSKACWILEFVAKKDIQVILTHIDTFTLGISKVQLDSSIRPVAKICELLMKAFFSKSKNEVQTKLKEYHLEKITTSCFDWLIGEHKVASKAYSMTSLYLLGNKFEWIRPELQIILEQNYSLGSAAYKARARQILALINKKNKTKKEKYK
ncbi:MAG: adenylosuccinate lyase [Eudoraea sp.]|uniref:adenylosuccinate lyase n=1 Tax=Eudoraea sp. TaxID=1979955 RepID=UPI003C759EC2